MRVDQGAMQFAMLVVDAQSAAQCIQIVLLAGKLFRGPVASVEDACVVAKSADQRIYQPQFGVRKPTSKLALWAMISAPETKPRKSSMTSRKRRLVEQKTIFDAMNGARAIVDRTIRIEIDVPGCDRWAAFQAVRHTRSQ